MRMLIVPVLERAEPYIKEWIDKEREVVIATLKEADSETIARQICDKIRESI